MTRFFKADFFGLAELKNGRIAAGGKVQSFEPTFEYVQISNSKEVSLKGIHEIEVGPFWRLEESRARKHVVVFKKDDLRIIDKNVLKDVILIPDFKDHNRRIRHLHDLVGDYQRGSVGDKPNSMIFRGMAYFSVDSPTTEELPNEKVKGTKGEVDAGGFEIKIGEESTQVGEGEKNFEDFNSEVNKRVLPLWNRWLNWLLLATGLGLMPFAPWLGLAALAQPLHSWSRTTGTSQGSGISFIWLLLAALVVGFAFFIGSPYAWPLAVVFLLMMIVRKGAKQGWVVAAVVLFILLALLALLPMLTERLTPKEDEDSKKANVKSRREKKEGSGEIISRHSIEWPYPQRTNLNLMQYATADAEYTKSLDNHDRVSKVSATEEMQFWNQAYRILLAHDQEKVDSIANIVQSVSEKRNFSTLQSAEYLVTMIQEIPYVLVHDMTCKEAVLQYKGFVAQYHMQGKPCLPNIVAGVQSPYEFMHNLKGDCDTRTLFAHAVLNKLGISSSVWVSSAYGHSILGVGVPGSSNNRKIVNGVPHYAVELTAKNFRIGMIAPEQNQMSNWKIAVYKNF
jgi:TRAP-type C4-dicarboxylate transport system permease small subunit